MREIYAAVVLVAAIASAVGAWGIVRYDTADVDRALMEVPGGSYDVTQPGGALYDAFVAITRNVSGEGVGGELDGPSARGRQADQTLQQLADLDRSYRSFREKSFGPVVDARIGSACSDPTPSNVTDCVRATRATLIELRQERDQERWIYDKLWIGARVLWAAAMFFALLWLFQAWSRLQQERRAGSRSAS
ncbi:MAG: hypothetical protein AAGF12_38430 [Myxococcota bacterium]